MTGARVKSVTLRVRDLDRATRFYTEVLGLEFGKSHGHGEPDDPWDGTEHCEAVMGEGDDFFIFVVQRLGEGLQPSHADFGVSVEDLDAVLERARAAGARMLHEPRAMPWGREARIEDPEGNIVGVTGD